MALDSRSTKILMLILNNQYINGKQIENTLNISRKQLGYSIKKINDFLLDNNLDIITRSKTGKFVVCKEIYQFFNKSIDDINISDYIFGEDERILLEIFIILLREEELSINHFVDILKVSTNTIFLDLKKVDEFLNTQNLKLMFDRKSGYFIEGNEFEKRMLLIKQINKFLLNDNNKKIFDIIFDIDVTKIKKIKELINKVENLLSITYTDTILDKLPYIIYTFTVRYNHNHCLNNLPLEYNNILGTNEFNSVFDIFGEYFNNNSNEILILTSQFKISSIKEISDNFLTDDIMKKAKMIINKFELLSCTSIYSDNLLKNLSQHLIPMLYRIEYGYHVENYLLNSILPNHQSLFDITKESLEILGIDIPNEEVAYITVLFGGYLSKANLSLQCDIKKIAIVVCTNGISISNLLFQNLKKVFPEFNFKCTLSKREFYQYKEFYDLVFSTVPLKTDKPLYLVNGIMSEKSINILRQSVLHRNNSRYDIFVDHIIDIVKNNAKNIKETQLKKELNDYFNIIDECRLNSEDLISINNFNLKKVLADRIYFMKKNRDNWEKIVDRCCENLLMKKFITNEYVLEIKRLIKEDKPIWNISKDIIVLHAGVDKGVNKLSMSLLVFDKEVTFNDYMKASIILVLATPNYNDHLNALYDFIEISEDKNKINLIKKCKNSSDIKTLIYGGD